MEPDPRMPHEDDEMNMDWSEREREYSAYLDEEAQRENGNADERQR